MVQSINPTQKNDETDGLPMPKRIWAVVSVGFALCMSVLDINIVNIVLPTLSHDFGTSPAVTTWIINGYQLAIVISLLSFSALGEIIGYRKVFRLSLKPWGIALKFLFLHHENILFPND